MWELINANKRKSLILFICMGICLVMLGYLIAAAWLGKDKGYSGVLIAFILWIILSLISYFAGDSILLSLSNAKEVSRDIHPQLFNVVEEMKIAANLPVMPKIYIIDDPSLNAFATGRDPNHSAIAVTAGLLSKLNRDELQGVIAHEMSHILNRDILFITFAGVMLGCIVMISDAFWRGMRYGGSARRYRSRSCGGGRAQLIIFIIAIVMAILAPIIARIFYFAISRKREYLADASGARLTRYPQGLACALEKISRGDFLPQNVNNITAPMYIVNPLTSQSFAGLFSTHPPTEERIKILRTISGGVSYQQYVKAFKSVNGSSANFIPASAMSDSDLEIRKPTQEEQPNQTVKEQTRQVGDLMRAVNNYAFLMCSCGLKIKVPSQFAQNNIQCPRCGRTVDMPLSQVQTAAAILSQTVDFTQTDSKIGNISGQQIYTRRTKSWESFKCSCGAAQNISPLFMAKFMNCQMCGKKIEIKSLEV